MCRHHGSNYCSHPPGSGQKLTMLCWLFQDTTAFWKTLGPGSSWSSTHTPHEWRPPLCKLFLCSGWVHLQHGNKIRRSSWWIHHDHERSNVHPNSWCFFGLGRWFGHRTTDALYVRWGAFALRSPLCQQVKSLFRHLLSYHHLMYPPVRAISADCQVHHSHIHV